ncbi:hypothetical protein H4R33_005953 [Dimargaris cristalligena]|nr:hypothetical protein H4R33_005953 [Dimargaris cristalligena]
MIEGIHQTTEDANSHANDNAHLNILVNTTRITAGLSIVGCLAVLVCLAFMRRLRTNSFKYTLVVTLADLIDVSAKALSRQPLDQWGGPNSAICQLQAILIQWGTLASILCSGLVAVNLVSVFLLDRQKSIIRRNQQFMLGTFFLLPLAIAVTPLVARDPNRVRGYGDADLWCWIPPQHLALQIVIWLAPLILVTVFLLATFGVVGYVIFHDVQSRTQNMTAIQQERVLRYKRLYSITTSLHMVVFLVSWSPTLIARFYSMAHDRTLSYPVALYFGAVSPLRGLFNCLIYFSLNFFTKGRQTKEVLHLDCPQPPDAVVSDKVITTTTATSPRDKGHYLSFGYLLSRQNVTHGTISFLQKGISSTVTNPSTSSDSKSSQDPKDSTAATVESKTGEPGGSDRRDSAAPEEPEEDLETVRAREIQRSTYISKIMRRRQTGHWESSFSTDASMEQLSIPRLTFDPHRKSTSVLASPIGRRQDMGHLSVYPTVPFEQIQSPTLSELSGVWSGGSGGLRPLPPFRKLEKAHRRYTSSSTSAGSSSVGSSNLTSTCAWGLGTDSDSSSPQRQSNDARQKLTSSRFLNYLLKANISGGSNVPFPRQRDSRLLTPGGLESLKRLTKHIIPTELDLAQDPIDDDEIDDLLSEMLTDLNRRTHYHHPYYPPTSLQATTPQVESPPPPITLSSPETPAMGTPKALKKMSPRNSLTIRLSRQHRRLPLLVPAATKPPRRFQRASVLPRLANMPTKPFKSKQPAVQNGHSSIQIQAYDFMGQWDPVAMYYFLDFGSGPSLKLHNPQILPMSGMIGARVENNQHHLP